jgi:hypothetical protein
MSGKQLLKALNFLVSGSFSSFPFPLIPSL